MEAEIQETESTETAKPNQTKNEPKSNTISITDLVATLKDVNTEEKKLLNQKKELEKTENDQRKATTEIENKKRTLAELITQIAFQQNKCRELEQAIGISIQE